MKIRENVLLNEAESNVKVSTSHGNYGASDIQQVFNQIPVTTLMYMPNLHTSIETSKSNLANLVRNVKMGGFINNIISKFNGMFNKKSKNTENTTKSALTHYSILSCYATHEGFELSITPNQNGEYSLSEPKKYAEGLLNAVLKCIFAFDSQGNNIDISTYEQLQTVMTTYGFVTWILKQNNTWIIFLDNNINAKPPNKTVISKVKNKVQDNKYINSEEIEDVDPDDLIDGSMSTHEDSASDDPNEDSEPDDSNVNNFG